MEVASSDPSRTALSPQECLLRRSGCSLSEPTSASLVMPRPCLLQQEGEKQQECYFPPGAGGAAARKEPVWEEKRGRS